MVDTQNATPAQKIVLEKIEAAGISVRAKYAAMTDTDKQRDTTLLNAWLAASNADFLGLSSADFIAGKTTRAMRLINQYSESGKTMIELTNGVMPDGTQI